MTDELRDRCLQAEREEAAKVRADRDRLASELEAERESHRVSHERMKTGWLETADKLDRLIAAARKAVAPLDNMVGVWPGDREAREALAALESALADGRTGEGEK